MYQVMVVDDEPIAVSSIKTVVDKKCEGFQVTATAYDGREALEKLKTFRPDVLVTDIQMQVMSGLDLVREARALYPELYCVIISGYQEFEYARQALKYRVADYILKPIVPSEMRKLFAKLKDCLLQDYYQERNRLIHRMVNQMPADSDELKRYFQSEQYYGAIVRRNGLPTRFSESGSKNEIFSDINELMLAYGRDDRETLYLCPLELVGDNYEEMIRHRIEKEQPDADYVTTVIFKKPVTAEHIGEMVRSLYSVLDGSVTVRKSRLLVMDGGEGFVRKKDSDYQELNQLVELAEKGSFDRFRKEMEKKILEWGAEERSQLWMESRIRQILYMLQRYGAVSEDYREYEYLMDDAFANAGNVEELAVSLGDIFFKDRKEETLSLQTESTGGYFNKIRTYIQRNMAEPLSLQTVSRDMGVSQTYLSRLFRKYEGVSFNNYLTALRMEKAKTLLRSEEKIFVKDVAEQVGYKDQFYFSRIFHTYTGVRPSEYIEKSAQEQ